MQGAQVLVGIVAAGYPHGSRGNREVTDYVNGMSMVAFSVFRIAQSPGHDELFLVSSFCGYWCSKLPPGGHKHMKTRSIVTDAFVHSPLFLGFHSETRAFL